MKKQKKFLGQLPMAAVLFFVGAAVLLISTGIGTAQAALTYFSEVYHAELNTFDIGVTLQENGSNISWRDYTGSNDAWNENTGVLLGNMLSEGEELVPGKTYPEVLTVYNSGNIDEYVRVKIYRYWLDENGSKMTDLSPSLIDLHFTENGWIEDTSESTPERTILYYNRILPVGSTTSPFADQIKIDEKIAEKVEEKVSTNEEGYTVIETIYKYDGVRFVLEANADAVQTHNAKAAIKSAWGVDVSLSGDSLTLG